MMKPALRIILGGDPNSNRAIEGRTAFLKDRFGACMVIATEKNIDRPQVNDEQNGQCLVVGAEGVLGFLTGYECLAKAVQGLVQ
ncbi:MAG: hypothetical protein KGJ93_05310 [Patescibacteria group bacterium]|nr:hypothetical protein [Patescibacteria group bacterium]